MRQQLVILCGGLGTRLGSLTRDMPKSMLPVGERPFLEYLLKRMSELPFDEVILLAGHLGEVIYEQFHGSIFNGVRVRVHVEKSAKGTLGAFNEIKSMLEDKVWICNGDTFINFEKLNELYRLFSTVDEMNYLFTAFVSDQSRYGGIELSETCFVEKFEEKQVNRKRSGLINSGFLKLNRADIFEALNRNGRSLENDLLAKLPVQRKLKAINGCVSDFIDFGIPKDFAKLASHVLSSFPDKAIFWDRDGTINHDNGYTHDLSDYYLLDYLDSGTSAFTSRETLNLIVSNQGGIALGIFSEEDFYRFHRHMKLDFLRRGMIINDVIMCPHHPEGLIPSLSKKCECRKPNTQMFRTLANNWDLKIEKCRFIGNAESDRQAAVSLGIPYLSITDESSCIDNVKEFLNDH